MAHSIVEEEEVSMEEGTCDLATTVVLLPEVTGFVGTSSQASVYGPIVASGKLSLAF